MRAELTAPYADVCAADLVLELDATPAVALEVLTLELAGFTLELRLLGHSHQAVVTAPGGFALSETVSCRPAEPGHLPAARALRRDGHAYAFSAEIVPIEEVDGDGLATAVAIDPHGLVGDFAGLPGAFTALRAAAIEEPDATGVRWETWHAYPQNGELVRTSGEVRRA